MPTTKQDTDRAAEIIEDFREHCNAHPRGTAFDSMIVSFFAVRIAKLEVEKKRRNLLSIIFKRK